MHFLNIHTQGGSRAYLTCDTLALLSVAGDHREATHALAIETKVLGKGLAEHDVVSVGNELADRISVGLRIATGKALCNEELFICQDDKLAS
jgi:hypothetical protein